MNNKVTMVALIGALALSACGQNGDQTPKMAQPTEPEITTPASSASVQPIATSVVTSAKLTGQSCSLDSIDGNYAARVQLAKGKAHVFRGWLESVQQKAAGAFDLVLVGNQDYSVAAETGVARPDVAKGENNPALATAGFNISVDLDSLPTGEYAVRFLMKSDNGAFWCDAKKGIVVPE